MHQTRIRVIRVNNLQLRMQIIHPALPHCFIMICFWSGLVTEVLHLITSFHSNVPWIAKEVHYHLFLLRQETVLHFELIFQETKLIILWKSRDNEWKKIWMNNIREIWWEFYIGNSVYQLERRRPWLKFKCVKKQIICNLIGWNSARIFNIFS